MVHCFNDAQPTAEVTATIETRGNSQGSLRWTFHPSEANPPDIAINRSGTMDFRRHSGPLRVTFSLVGGDPERTFFSGGGVNVLGYSANATYEAMTPVGSGHFQIADIDVSDDGRTVSFCYRNRDDGGNRAWAGRFGGVRYTLYLGERGRATYLPFWIDPIISNSGNQITD